MATLMMDVPLATTFTGVSTIQTMGVNVAGGAYPVGIPGSIVISDGVAKLTVNETDPVTFGGKRTEMTFTGHRPTTGEVWYKWQFMIPSAYQFDAEMTVAQFHETPDATDPEAAVQFVLLLHKTRLYARVPSSILTSSTASHRLASFPFEYDRWYEICLHANWQPTASGFWEMFVDRIPMFRAWNVANAYVDEIGGYLKLGIYNFNSLSGWGTKIGYYSNVKVWAGSASYEAILGGTPLQPPVMLEL